MAILVLNFFVRGIPCALSQFKVGFFLPVGLDTWNQDTREAHEIRGGSPAFVLYRSDGQEDAQRYQPVIHTAGKVCRRAPRHDARRAGSSCRFESLRTTNLPDTVASGYSIENQRTESFQISITVPIRLPTKEDPHVGFTHDSDLY